MTDVKTTQFEDGARCALNTIVGEISIVDRDGDAAEITLDAVGAMRLAECLTEWVADNMGEDNAAAVAKCNAALDALGAVKRAQREAGL